MSLGWQQFTGIQSFPAVAGSLAQLVQIDIAAAEKALLTLLTQPVLARAMGSAAACRARQMFDPEKVMNDHEELFAELNEIRRCAPDDAHISNRVTPQLDPVRVFAGFASHQSLSVQSSVTSTDTLPEPVRRQRNPIWRILYESAHQSARICLDRDLALKHQQM